MHALCPTQCLHPCTRSHDQVSEASVIAKKTFLDAATSADLKTVHLREARLRVSAEIAATLTDMFSTFSANNDNSVDTGGNNHYNAEKYDVNEREECFGMTALHWAKLYGAGGLEALLREHGAVDLEDSAGKCVGTANCDLRRTSSRTRMKVC